jgi:hypothetical protein
VNQDLAMTFSGMATLAKLYVQRATVRGLVRWALS